jgi:phosphatidylglycerophosphatase A
MAIKESSDELNPSVLNAQAAVTRPRPAHSFKDYLALAIATCGVGYLPLAPGTWGSLVGVALYFGLRAVLLSVLWSLASHRHLDLSHIAYSLVILELLAVVCVSIVGIWAASQTEKLSGKKDPGKVVIDEVAGQMLALTAMPLAVETWWTILLAFLAFRVFDIIKPYPARRFEALESGLGIMADDIVAGAYGAIVVGLVVVIRWFV